MDANQKRRVNIRYLTDTRLSRKALAEKLGYDGPNYINQLCGRLGSFGSGTARKVEKVLGLEHGWMDELHLDIYSVDDGRAAPPSPTPNKDKVDALGLTEAECLKILNWIDVQRVKP